MGVPEPATPANIEFDLVGDEDPLVVEGWDGHRFIHTAELGARG